MIQFNQLKHSLFVMFLMSIQRIRIGQDSNWVNQHFYMCMILLIWISNVNASVIRVSLIRIWLSLIHLIRITLYSIRLILIELSLVRLLLYWLLLLWLILLLINLLIFAIIILGLIVSWFVWLINFHSNIYLKYLFSFSLQP